MDPSDFAVRRAVRRRGFVQLDSVATDLADAGTLVDISEIRALVEDMGGLTSLADGLTFAVLHDPTSPLWSAVARMLLVRSPLPLETLRAGLARSRPGRDQSAIRLSARTLEEMFERSNLIEGEGEDWKWGGHR